MKTFFHFPIDYIKTSLVFVETLNISFNSIRNLSSDGFSGLTSMKFLFLQGNRFGNNVMKYENIFRGLKHLVTLNIGDNFIKTLPNKMFQPLVSLKYLFLAGNNINFIDFYLPDSLQYFDFSQNELQSISAKNFELFNNLKNLRLNLDGNVLP